MLFSWSGGNGHAQEGMLTGGSNPSGRRDFVLASTTPLNGVRVLVVEDSWHLASALKSIVENGGMEVVGSAATLAEAERFLDSSEPDMAIVDVNLQGEETYGLIEQLVARGIPVIIISGYEVLPAVTDLADAVLKKPIRASALLSTLQRIAAKRETQ